MASCRRRQRRRTDHGRLPLTCLAATAQDRILPDPAPVASALATYAETDLLCYRAEHPAKLVQRQAAAWQPWLDWVAATHGARLMQVSGIIHVKQDPAALQAVQDAYARQPVPVLAALGVAVPALGSAVLGLALGRWSAGRRRSASARRPG